LIVKLILSRIFSDLIALDFDYSLLNKEHSPQMKKNYFSLKNLQHFEIVRKKIALYLDKSNQDFQRYYLPHQEMPVYYLEML
jgi:hypothetical protein